LDGSATASSQHSRSRSARPHSNRNNNQPLQPIVEEGGGENEVMQHPNVTGNTRKNIVGNAGQNAGVDPQPYELRVSSGTAKINNDLLETSSRL
jgi:hypothetical protein